MFVDASRFASLKRSWHLLAEGDDGPLIPSMATETIIRNALRGRPPATGARAAIRALELEDYRHSFDRRKFTGICDGDDDATARRSTPRILSSAWQLLPLPIRHMHEALGTARSEGSRESGARARLVGATAAAIIGFPPAPADVAVVVEFDAAKGEETWRRTFGKRSFSSRQSSGRGQSQHLLCEHFGPLRFDMALVASGERLSLVLGRWSIFGLPLPMALCPHSESYESAEKRPIQSPRPDQSSADRTHRPI